MRSSAVIVNGDKYYCITRGRGTYGLDFLIGISDFRLLDESDDEQIGKDILKATDNYVDSSENEDEVGSEFDEAVKKLGFRDVEEFKRKSLFLSIGGEDGVYQIKPSIRRGSRRSNFEFLEPVFSRSTAPSDIGAAFKEALARCR